VIGPESERLLEIPAPFTVEVPGKGKDQVERDVGDAAASQRRDGAPDLAGVVGPVHPLQRLGIEALGSEGDSVDPGGDPVGDADITHVVGICLEGNLCPATDLHTIPHNSEQVGNSCPADAGWCAATHVNRVEDGSLEIVTKTGDLSSYRPEVLVDGRLVPYRDREIAVGAPPGAEGDVNVEMRSRHLLNIGARGRTEADDQGH